MRPAVESALEVCPVEVAVAVLGGSWKLTIVKHLLEGTLRFGELRRAVGPVTPRVLTRQLRDLETDGLVSRTVFAEVPPRVEYALTDLGETLRPAIAWLDDWGASFEESARSAPAGE